MGIDPLTHKPLSTTDDQQPQVKINQQEQEPLMINDESIIDRNNKEPETSVQSSITEVNKEEDKAMSMTSSPLFDHIDAATMEIMKNNFCTDDVPLIEPHEILVPCSTASTSSSSCSYSSENSSNKLPEEWQFHDFEWAAASNNYGNINMSLWDDDLGNWDLLINDDDGFATSATFSQCPRMDYDQDSWKFGLL